MVLFTIPVAAVRLLVKRGRDVTLHRLSGGQSTGTRLFDELVLRKRKNGVLTIALKLAEL